jgi:hypothetical protein
MTIFAHLTKNALEPLIQNTLRGLEEEHRVDDLSVIRDWPGLVAQRLAETPGTETVLFDSLADLIADVSQVGTRIAEFTFDAATVGNLGVTLLREPGEQAQLKVRAPAPMFWTVSQNQGKPTSAGSTRTAILIAPQAAHRGHPRSSGTSTTGLDVHERRRPPGPAREQGVVRGVSLWRR